MNAKIKIFLLCPVPEEQKPLNEYILLKKSNLLSWAFLPFRQYIVKIISTSFLYFPIILICLLNLTPFSIINIIQVFLISSTIFFSVIYTRFSDVYKKLNQARVFYEEASWFDGKIWEKPFFLIKNDKLINNQKVQPILKRLKYTILINSFITFCFLNF
jgi:hypothetical protein